MSANTHWLGGASPVSGRSPAHWEYQGVQHILFRHDIARRKKALPLPVVVGGGVIREAKLGNLHVVDRLAVDSLIGATRIRWRACAYNLARAKPLAAAARTDV